MRASRISAVLLSLALAVGLALSGAARADVDNAGGTNVQDGNNRGTTTQAGTGKSGDAVGGQVAGVVSSGRTSVDARNNSSNSDVTSGDVNGSNTSSSFVGQNSNVNIGGPSSGPVIGDVSNSFASANLQDGDNRYTLNQAANLTTGDGVAGEVIGVVTAGGGSASVVAANRSDSVDVTTGDAEGSNDAAAFVGQNASVCVTNFEICESGPAITGDIDNSGASANLQEGDNRSTASQRLNANTGDGVAGQVIGVVSAGATSVDANNSSTNVSVETGDANAENDLATYAGQNATVCVVLSFAFGTCTAGPLLSADITNSTAATNLQEGDNRVTARQNANAASGDGVAGEVIGAVTSAGGSTSIVAANTSSNSDVTTGDAESTNDLALFAGQNFSFCVAVSTGLIGSATCTAGPALTADVTSANAANVQDGSNRATASQSANANTGDGVAGQVIGAVSAGATSIDARNNTDGVSVETGDADASNAASMFVGQNVSACVAAAFGVVAFADCTAGPTLNTADVSSVTAINVQDGGNRGTLNQNANATSGDGVGGEVIGAVTSAGGSASIVASNSTTDTDVTTGDADASNVARAFVGQNLSLCVATASAFEFASDTCTAGTPPAQTVATADVSSATAVNAQDGNNRLTGNQTANANTGDGVGGQVIGVVSAGAASVDAANRTDDSSVETGDADSSNDFSAFVGLNANFATASVRQIQCCDSVDVSNVGSISGVPSNVQDGSNSKTLSQSANASSGDAVAGQVTGVVTSAGGSASVVVANTSSGIDSLSGDSEFDNSQDTFVGLNVEAFTLPLIL